MIRNKRILLMILLVLLLIFLPNMVKATVEYTRTIPSNEGTIIINFTGLALDEAKEYEFALVRQGGTPTDWFSIDDGYTKTNSSVTLKSGTAKMANVLAQTDTGYIYIREKNSKTNILESYKINLKLPYLQSLGYSDNGERYQDYNKKLYEKIGNSYDWEHRNYIYWQKITDKSLISKFLEIKNSKNSITNLENALPNPPITGYIEMQHSTYYKEKNDGLYLLWVKRTGENCKDVYSCIVHDGLPKATTLEEYNIGTGSHVSLTGISLPSTKQITLGKTITLTPSFNPSNATNKIVTWSSSDETVATVDNAGKVTPKKVGSTIITVTSQDGNKKATCTVTVTKSLEEITTRYISFPLVIFNGKSSLSVKNYKGEYTLYYQFVEVNDEIVKKVEELKEQYKEKKISYSELLENYEKLLPQYDEKKWVETKDGNFEIDLSKFEGTKKFALYAKLVMSDKTVYEAEIYTFDGNEKATNVPNGQDKLDNKDTTTAKTALPKTGKIIFIWIALVLVCSAIIANVRYKKLYK